MNLQTIMVRNNYSVTLGNIDVGGHQGILFIAQTPNQAKTDTASVIVKLDGEKPVKQKINTMVEWEGIKEYLSEFYINAEYIKCWNI